MTEQSKALTFDQDRGGLQLHTVDDAIFFAQQLLAEGLAPKQLNTAGKIVICLQAGSEVGLPPMMSLKNIVPINGVPTVWGEAAKGLVLRTGQVDEWEDWWEIDGMRVPDPSEFPDALTAVTRLKRKSGGEVTRAFSVADAKRGKIWMKSQSPWITYPQRMLRIRAMTWAMRDLFADALGGLSIREEVEDLPPREVTPETTTLEALGLGEKTAAEQFVEEALRPAPSPVEQHLAAIVREWTGTETDPDDGRPVHDTLDVEQDDLEPRMMISALVKLIKTPKDAEKFADYCDKKHGLPVEILDAGEQDTFAEKLMELFRGNREALDDVYQHAIKKAAE